MFATPGIQFDRNEFETMLEAGINSTAKFAIVKTKFDNKMYQYGFNSTFLVVYCT